MSPASFFGGEMQYSGRKAAFGHCTLVQDLQNPMALLWMLSFLPDQSQSSQSYGLFYRLSKNYCLLAWFLSSRKPLRGCKAQFQAHYFVFVLAQMDLSPTTQRNLKYFLVYRIHWCPFLNFWCLVSFSDPKPIILWGSLRAPDSCARYCFQISIEDQTFAQLCLARILMEF